MSDVEGVHNWQMQNFKENFLGLHKTKNTHGIVLMFRRDTSHIKNDNFIYIPSDVLNDHMISDRQKIQVSLCLSLIAKCHLVTFYMYRVRAVHNIQNIEEK